MNFFKEQEEARKRIRRFKFTFFLVVLFTTLVTSFFLTFFSGFSERKIVTETTYGDYESSLDTSVVTKDSAGRFAVVFIGTLGFILCLSWFKRWTLREGGPKIAEMVGGVPLTTDRASLPYQKLQNTVEEMSIAAGIVPPKVYVLPHENHINAFAAGFTSHDSVVAVSRGCLEKLNRDELQGVVAHEIGHIINGDMKLNLELIGYLHGLMGISHIGRSMMRNSGRSSSRDKKGNAGLIGFGLYLIGMIGYFFGLMLKFSISRGQEYHADAKAVQLSRNPDGIGGALKKIMAIENQFKVAAANASEISHLYFFYPDSSSFFSTHPPLPDRIKRILPSFKISEYSVNEKPGIAKLMNATNSNEFIKSFTETVPAANIMASTQELEEETFQLFHRISSSENAKSGKFLNMNMDDVIVAMDLNIGRLKSLPEEDKKAILEKCRAIILEDKKIVAREILCFTLYKECLTKRTKLSSSKTLEQKTTEVSQVMSFLATLGPTNQGERKKAHREGMNFLFPDKVLEMSANLGVKVVMDSLEALRDLRPYDKERVLNASKIVIEFDKLTTADEKTFLKVLSQVLDVPSP